MAQKISVINIGLVGGGPMCTEILEKTTSVVRQEEIDAPVVAVADPDPQSPGVQLARKLGLQTFADYRELYNPRQRIDLIIVLTPDPGILRKILISRPPRIRILSYQVFRLFWTAIGREERKLRERTREMETLVNGIQDFILVITPDMTVVEVNEAFLEKMGYTRAEVIGRKCYEVYHRVDRPCTLPESVCPLAAVIQDKRKIRQIQKRSLPNDEIRFYEVNIYPIWEKSGKVSKFIHISRDITEQRRQEEEITRRLERMVADRTRELRETHAKLLHQDKMASLGKLSAAVVHEINNPIAGLLNLVLLMKRMIAEDALGPGEIERFQAYLNLMETETRRTSRIVSNLLAFSRQPKMKMKPVDVNRLIERTLLLNASLLVIANVKSKARLEPELPEIVGNEDQLQQVFMNLISNAVQAMESGDGGVLKITTRRSPRGNGIRIKIRDTGVGIPPENMSKLFEPFFTTKKKGKGVGLGLSVAYGIIQEHGGSIYVSSRIAKGSTFRIDLPAVRPPA
jgi:PAS domain S-box-containing protein